MAATVDPATRKRVLKVITISLLLDLVGNQPREPFCPRFHVTDSSSQISFTFILPLFPKLLEFYRDREAPASLSGASPTLLQTVLSYLNKYKAAFSRPIDSRYDIVLLGGALGSLFSCVFPLHPGASCHLYYANSFANFLFTASSRLLLPR